jgi:hypothetical protein
VPPHVDENGYGLRVPGLVISPYARRGYIDHQVLSFDAYLKFIEDDFLGGARIDPKTDGRPDPRPDVREKARILGNLGGGLRLPPPAPRALLAAAATYNGTVDPGDEHSIGKVLTAGGRRLRGGSLRLSPAEGSRSRAASKSARELTGSPCEASVTATSGPAPRAPVT